MHDDIEEQMGDWGRGQREESTREAPESILRAVRDAGDDGLYQRIHRPIVRVTLPLTAAAAVALAAMIWFNSASNAPGPTGPSAGGASSSAGDASVDGAALERRPTAFALLVANDGYAREELVLPRGNSVGWTSRVPALGN